jgi:hypothetical protein
LRLPERLSCHRPHPPAVTYTCDGECSWNLGRVHREPAELGEAMRADPKGPEHFTGAPAMIDELDRAVGEDTFAAGLRAHREELRRRRRTRAGTGHTLGA